jgi:hypothetical protein
MKKIVTIGAIAVLAAGFMFADEPAIDMKIAEFNGEAGVKWGVDLDAGQHGFENTTGSLNLKVNLWNEGTKATTGEGVWGEIEIKGKALAIKNKAWDGDGNVSLEKALIHLGENAYIGVKSGDTEVGEYKFTSAIRSAGNDNAKWLANVGPKNFSEGIVVGYGNDMFGLDVDFRSYYDKDTTNTYYTSAYAIAAEAKLKDSLVPGLTADAGIAYNLSDNFKTKGKDTANGILGDSYALKFDEPASFAAAAKKDDPAKTAEEKAVEDAKKAYEKTPTAATYKTWKDAEQALEIAKQVKANSDAANAAAGKADSRSKELKFHEFAYAANAAYKFAIDDKFYVKPEVGFQGAIVTGAKENFSSTGIGNALVAGVTFGWGATADANAGVPFLDGDGAKQVTPGVSVVVAVPLATNIKTNNNGTSGTQIDHNAITALIVPSFYTNGDLIDDVPLKAGVYSEMALLNYKEPADRSKTSGTTTESWGVAVEKTRTFALALAAGVAYDFKATDEITVTPKAGIRYANSAYVENKINTISPLKSNPIFEAGYGKMGVSQKKKDGDKNDINNYFNLKAGLDVNGVIPNTKLFLEYASANLMNDNEYTETTVGKNQYGEVNKFYNIKAGTFNVGCNIHF